MPADLPPFDAQLDLVLTRVVPVPRHLVWKAWTTPELLMQWFTPKPWETVACEIDLRPGGAFNTTMRSPEGTDYPNSGCYLDVVEGERLVFTDALTEGFRPSGKGFMTAYIRLEDAGEGTRYTAQVLHKDVGDRDRHAAMGFADGWGTALDQLAALMTDG